MSKLYLLIPIFGTKIQIFYVENEGNGIAISGAKIQMFYDENKREYIAIFGAKIQIFYVENKLWFFARKLKYFKLKIYYDFCHKNLNILQCKLTTCRFNVEFWRKISNILDDTFRLMFNHILKSLQFDKFLSGDFPMIIACRHNSQVHQFCSSNR